MKRFVPGALALLCWGCGYVGDPMPPLLNLPARVTDLAAVQRGGNLIVQFTVPRLTTEGVAVRRGLELDLRAGPAGDPFQESAWAAAAKRLPEPKVSNGVARVEVPAAEWTGREIVIGVRAANAAGKDAGWSNFAVLPVVPPPPAPADVKAEAVPEGVRLTWRAPERAFRVFRRAAGEAAFSRVAEPAAPEWIDKDTKYGAAYRYMVQGVVKTGTAEAESEPSAETEIVPRDFFPPAAPAGLTAGPSAGSIELAWDRNAEPDLAKYRVYRAAGTGPWERIAETGEAPAYSDRKLESGKTYRYAVSAVDRAGNESKMSEPVEAVAP